MVVVGEGDEQEDALSDAEKREDERVKAEKDRPVAAPPTPGLWDRLRALARDYW